jgi:hypothetical protein
VSVSALFVRAYDHFTGGGLKGSGCPVFGVEEFPEKRIEIDAHPFCAQKPGVRKMVCKLLNTAIWN